MKSQKNENIKTAAGVGGILGAGCLIYLLWIAVVVVVVGLVIKAIFL